LGDGQKQKITQVGLDHTSIKDAKQLMEMNKTEGKGDVIPTVPSNQATSSPTTKTDKTNKTQPAQK